MNLNLTAKTAVVTGASRGIGLATVQALIGEGARVVGAARTITSELTDTGAYTVSADLSTAEGVAGLIDTALTELGGIDLLVNNVGRGDDPADSFLDADDTVWTTMFDINVLSAVRATRAALPSLLERGGAIVNVSSVRARMPAGPPIAYGATKAALTAFGKSLAEELGPRGVRVNTVSPGAVRTFVYQDPDGPVAQRAAATETSLSDIAAEVAAEQNIATGRMAEPHEVAALIVFLLSEVAGNITGSDYVIDGGTVKTI